MSLCRRRCRQQPVEHPGCRRRVDHDRSQGNPTIRTLPSIDLITAPQPFLPIGVASAQPPAFAARSIARHPQSWAQSHAPTPTSLPAPQDRPSDSPSAAGPGPPVSPTTPEVRTPTGGVELTGFGQSGAKALNLSAEWRLRREGEGFGDGFGLRKRSPGGG